MPQTIKITLGDMVKNGLTIKDFVRVADLSEWGLDDSIIENMLQYEIFPQTFWYREAPWVIRNDMLKVINQLLKNNLAVYATVEALDEQEKQIREAIESNTVALSDEDMASIEAGQISYADLLMGKIAEKQATN